MKRHYYVSDDLAALRNADTRLQEAGISKPQIHVLSNDDAGTELAQLNPVEAVLKKDVVHGTERGAIAGVGCAAAVLFLFWISGLTATYTWVPAILLAIIVLGFCTWEGGLIGIQEPHYDFRRFEDQLAQGRHILLVDVPANQQQLLAKTMHASPELYELGEGDATPGWVIGARNKWTRFMELAP